MREYRVKQSTDGWWFVTAPDGQVIAHGLSNAAAWGVSDRRNDEASTPRQMRDAYIKPAADLSEADGPPLDAA